MCLIDGSRIALSAKSQFPQRVFHFFFVVMGLACRKLCNICSTLNTYFHFIFILICWGYRKLQHSTLVFLLISMGLACQKMRNICSSLNDGCPTLSSMMGLRLRRLPKTYENLLPQHVFHFFFTYFDGFGLPKNLQHLRLPEHIFARCLYFDGLGLPKTATSNGRSFFFSFF